MISEVKNVELILENCEVIVIDAKDIVAMRVKSPIEEVFIHGNQEHRSIMPEYFIIELAEDANESEITSTLGVQFEDKFTPFERLMKYNDLTNVIINYSDGSERKYVMPWGREEYVNEYQSTYVKDGRLLLVTDGAYERSSFAYLHQMKREYRGN